MDQIGDEKLRDFFEKDFIQDDIDLKLTQKGQAFFEHNCPTISLMLLAKSLPSTYACGNGAMVVYKTGRFLRSSNDEKNADFKERLMETAQFVIDVMSKGGLDNDKSGIASIIKVRLIHAAVRYYLKNNAHFEWNTEKYGEPINQEDMLGTLISFAVYPI